MLSKKKILIVSVVLASMLVAVLVFLLGPRLDRTQAFTPYTLPKEISALNDYLKSGENKYKIKAEREKTIIWNEGIHKTEYAVVYLHGFTADRKEISPVAERVAQRLNANLFATRFTGHGIDADAYQEATLPRWLRDVDEAIRIGNMIGEKTIVIATSTGGTLASLADQSTVYANIWVSPNFHPKDKMASIILIPWGAHLLTLIKDKYQMDEHTNEPEFLTSAYIPMMLTVEALERKNLSEFHTPTLIFMSSKDKTVSPQKTLEGFERIGAPFKKLVIYDNAEDTNKHVITGNTKSPNATELFIDESYHFIMSVKLGNDK